ncbi:hypothetical protein [Leptospira stimsonii]|uniref:Transposase n=1 Tax=Leptospira stimsonii TaxID=2202203 RepID=A0ABY2N383_9LEPT|nr:hypothetical protein [Leptospira stimsonii]TGK26084.1 hypothetical protein EHO98_00770 [Leptospira stimsonii]TGM14912.1 hypothetical protein EHQ90_10560 [Leptospira stimsonii]
MKQSKPDDEFPMFVIEYFIRKIRIRHFQRVKFGSNRRRELTSERTWYQSFTVNKSKLDRIHNDLVGQKDIERSEDDLWKMLIPFQTKKLKKYYDLLSAWQATEYRILEKINLRDFPKAINSIWWVASKRQVQKLGRRIERYEVPVYKPGRYLKIQRQKLKLLYTRSPFNSEEEGWNKAEIAGVQKVKNRYGKEWEEAIRVQVNKFGRR